ncbi:LVIVD repeat-containing protein [Zhouia amylolytica]|uniref:LVIVD repeat-containing protein n=1 Tax=Zhouia amylolytica AD3 TaxID=1286632 RepID=W2UIA0_9FLAO|nr:hypothetical protein [Zhouia amylolytica]ETN93880.1 hypothetical protein P278_32900 [Zhouia amylolytica AD3]
MKTKLILLCFLSLLIASCHSDDEYEVMNVAVPQYMTMETLRSSVDITVPQPVLESGKIYVQEDLVLINDVKEGIHVIDNSDPENPEKIAFVKIPGNMDMEMKGDFLYADSYVDLVVFDLSDLDKIQEISRLKDVFSYYPVFPNDETIDVVDYSKFPDTEAVIVGWEVKKERREIDGYDTGIFTMDAFSSENSAAVAGQGGSLARFKIVEDYMYSVDSHSIHVFDIKDLEAPKKLNQVHAGFDIETIFNRGEHLFLGSRSGMFVFDLSVPSAPNYIAEFLHGTACDPVVVDGDYAYITLRGGNSCGAFESSLQIVDVTDIANPFLVKTYSMDGPYGLGVKDDMLFVCDGESGLKVYDKTNVEDLQLINHLEGMMTYDVIPMQEILMMIGEQRLYQYSYQEDGVKLISQFSLD